MPEYRHINIGQHVRCECSIYQEQLGDGGIRHIIRIHNMLMRSYWTPNDHCYKHYEERVDYIIMVSKASITCIYQRYQYQYQ